MLKMQMNNKYVKILFLLFIIISIAECIYLFIIPFLVEKFLPDDYIKQTVQANTNILIDYDKLKIKTHFTPYVTLMLPHITVKDKQNNDIFLDADTLKVDIRIPSLLLKKISLKEISSEKAVIHIKRFKNGSFNFENLFPKKEKKGFALKLNDSKIDISNLSIESFDEETSETFYIDKMPLEIINNSKYKTLSVKTKGQINSSNNKSDFDVDIISTFPFNLKNIDKNEITGNIFAYDLNLKTLKPYLQKYVDNRIKEIDGIVEFIQISTGEKSNQISINSSFDNIIFNKSNWTNYIQANGKNKFDLSLEYSDKKINIRLFKFIADKVNIKGLGSIAFNKKPELDLSIEVLKSRAENIASLLPPTLVPSTMAIEKVKHYGVFGDVEAKVKVKGTVPQPDITGYVIGNNVHVLDKKLHKLHKGTVKLVFDKRILNMDILVEMFNNQKAKVVGSVHMFRDGVNNVTVETTDNIDFSLAQKIIVPVSKVFLFQLGPIPEMNITSGIGKISLKIQGSLDFVKIYGYSFFDKARLTYNGLFGEVLDGKGRLDFKDDIITFKSERAFVKENPLSVSGKVQINNNLDFDISSDDADGTDLLEIINKSELLKDVKKGIAVITSAKGKTKIFVNMKAKIVPVPFGQPPLPPEEAFEDLRVKGNLQLLGNSGTIEGFKVPIEKLKGLINFTETKVDFNNIEGISGTSPIVISGEIITDLKTKIPDVDIVVKSDSVNLRDTIKFLTESYLYPAEYPDLSPLYNIASKHDLYFKYKAKSIDFLTDKAYAVINFIEDHTDSELKATSGKIVLDKSTVKVEDVKADLFDSILSVNGTVEHVDRPVPIYNLNVKTSNLNLENLNDFAKIEVVPAKTNKILSLINDFKGIADIDFEIKNNIFGGNIKLKHPEFKYINPEIPFAFDDFNVNIKNNKIILNDVAGTISDMPFFFNVQVADFYKNPNITGYFTLKIKDSFISDYFPQEIDDLINISGDISFSAKFDGNSENLSIEPKLTLYPNADMEAAGISLGEVNDTRVFEGKINLKKNKIYINKIDYIKYIASQNNKTYPVLFTSGSGILNIDKNTKKIEPEEISIKTNNNISAKILNIFLKTPVFEHGTFNCDLKYKFDKLKNLGYLSGNADCRNLDIPLFDTLIKNIRINTSGNDINIQLFAFMNDSRLNVDSVLENNLYETPKIRSLKITADEIDNDKLFRSLSKTQKAINTNNKIKNTNLAGLSIENGLIDIKKYVIKSLIAENLISDFYIDKNGVFYADNINVNVNQGNIRGNVQYNLNNSKMEGNFELHNVDSNYVAETLFDGKNQIYGNANGKIILKTQGYTNEEIIKNLSGFVYFDISDGRMPKLGSLEYLLHAGNIIKSGLTGLTINSVLELLNLVKTGYFSNINGSCAINNGIAENIEIFSKGENLSLYIHGKYDIGSTTADMEVLGKLSKKISTIFGTIGNTSLNTFFKLIPGVSMLDFGRKDFIENVEKIPSFTNGDFEARTFQAIINGDINSSNYVQSFKWVKE